MRTIRIYQSGHYVAEEMISLTEEAGQHVGVVLRMRQHEKLILFNGHNVECDAEIVSVHKRHVKVLIHQVREVSRESPLVIHLVQAISKGERMEWVVQKATELGVHTIHPVITQHGAYKLDESRLIKKQQQWQSIAIAACEQCGRNQLPIIASAMTLDAFLQGRALRDAYVLEPYSGKPVREYSRPVHELTLMIGPEGGFSQPELANVLAAGASPLTFGPRILRTETAAICGLSVVQATWGDL